MTKKDYIVLAAAINRSVQKIRESDQSFIPVYTVAQCLADELQKDNPRFDRMTFLRAAGLVPA